MEPIEEEQRVERKGRAPVDVERTARIIDREEQVETIKDAFGEEVTRRFIRQRIMEVEAKRGGDSNDLAALDDDGMVDRFLDQRGQSGSSQQP
jgi:hypothetical protein